VWATTGVSGGQVAYHIGDREKESPESIDIRIRDPANSEIPIEVTGGGKVNSHVCIGVSSRRVSESVNQVLDIASGEITIREVPNSKGKRSALTGHRVSGIREPSDRPLNCEVASSDFPISKERGIV
jgi:hypothetical protein